MPTLSIGLPVYNGERYLRESLDALLAQTWTDFELIIADNASTDSTPQIIAEYAARDPRIRTLRHPRNIGAAPNHNAVFEVSHGRYFKWASHDDLYDPELVRRCVEALEEHPEAVLAHAWDAFVDEHGTVSDPVPYLLDTADPRPSVRLRSLLHVSGGNDIYGVIRREALEAVGPMDSYHNADRTFVAALGLLGPFHQVPEVLYFRRDHPQRAERSGSRRIRSANLDPRRGNRLTHPMARLYLEYVAGYLRIVLTTPMPLLERLRCLASVVGWLRVATGSSSLERRLASNDPAIRALAEEEQQRHLQHHGRRTGTPAPGADAAERPGPLGRTLRRMAVHSVNQVSDLVGDDVLGRTIRVALLRRLGAEVGAGSSMHGGTWFGEPRRLRIGRDVFVNRGCYLDLEGTIRVEDGATVGHGCTLVTTHHEVGPTESRCGPYEGRDVTIGRGAWLGANVTVLPGVTVGAGAVVGAGSVVTGDVAPDTVVAGAPARPVSTRLP